MWGNPVSTDYMTRNLTLLLLNWHFSFLRVTSAFLMFFKVVFTRYSLYSSWVWPWMMTSLNKHITLACPSRMSLIHFWKCSEELVILKEAFCWNKNGCMEWRLLWEGAILHPGGFSQNLMLASNLLKTLTPADSCLSLLATIGRGNLSEDAT